jgi:hypothetical protein
LVSFDRAWTKFEHVYIMEIINIEKQSRQLVVDAVKREQALQLIENTAPADTRVIDLPKYREELSSLVTSVSCLNGRVNVSRKAWCDDVSVDILLRAYATLQVCAQEDSVDDDDGSLNAAWILATDVVESFTAVRNYLRKVSKCFAKVDPHLSNNVGLASCLAAWDESWEIGSRYLQHEPLLNALRAAVAHVRAAQKFAPEFAVMCDNYDADLFLVLPRLIWLRFLAEPITQSELLKKLLPHRFTGVVEPTEEIQIWDADIADLIEKYQKVKHFFGSADSQSPYAATWKTLVKLLVNRRTDESIYEEIAHDTRLEAQVSTEDLLRDLERWSMELQRHCPEAWNQCSAILVHCLTGDATKSTHEPFRI